MKLSSSAAALVTAALLTIPAGASGTPTAHAAGTAARDAAALPNVNMEATVKAAQIDPRRADDTRTPGAEKSVLLVERALRDRKLLDAKWVDGYFGTSTVAAYAKYQKSLGYTGLDASGLPGRTSLTKLGDGRFTVTRVIGPGSRVSTGGVVVNTRTQRMLAEAERLLGRGLVLEQGSYNPGGDPTSAGTHDGGGVVDISVRGMTPAAPHRDRPRAPPGRLRGVGAQPRPGRLAVAHPRRRHQRHRPVQPGPAPDR
ncbi:peptidoglycan-binding protein [Actinomadura sp. CNU-125]|uniref:peptidoglycan-binding protein n=1 Tax=Actinomadura sp. CNU-125 TaxID=1904961 RepID=UPI000A69521D|nr:peptidoglycan-binding protein [Actinomadura sp. CNU-125]